MPSLVFRIPGQQSFRTVHLYKNVTTIGSDADNDIHIGDAEVNAYHGVVHFDGKCFTIKGVDRILVMHKGQVVEEGTHAELLEKRGIYYRLYILQYKGQENNKDASAA